MAEAHSRQLWDHTSQILCWMANAWNPREDGEAHDPKQFHAHEQGGAEEAAKKAPDFTLDGKASVRLLKKLGEKMGGNGGR
jgi:hypothetical protein